MGAVAAVVDIGAGRGKKPLDPLDALKGRVARRGLAIVVRARLPPKLAETSSRLAQRNH